MKNYVNQFRKEFPNFVIRQHISPILNCFRVLSSFLKDKSPKSLRRLSAQSGISCDLLSTIV